MEDVKGNLTHRQRQALATQNLILEAAQELFLEQGYGSTTIENIAGEAGVAVSTVYAVFGSKRGILKAIRQAWHQASRQREIYQAALEEQDVRRKVELAAYATRRQWETSGRMIVIYKGAAAVDREAAAELEEALQGRRTFISTFIQALAPHLASHLDRPRAAQIFLALTLPEIYQELVDVDGWSPEAYEAWLAGVLQQQLLESRRE